MSLFWRELFRLQGTDLKRSTAYHPQTDGQSENVNKALETYLRCSVNGQPKQWSKWLSWAEFWYNTSPHVSTHMTPFKALYGLAKHMWTPLTTSSKSEMQSYMICE